jgi:hypothetical protein
MKSCLFVCIAALLWSVPALAQQSHMSQWLNTGTDKERVQKLVSLGVGRDAAELADFSEEIVWLPVRSESRHEMAILFTPCGAEYLASLHLLENAQNGWHVTDSTGFDCHYDDSVSVEIASVRNTNVDDVFVHNECEEHGTGFVQQNFNVFAIKSGKLKLALNAEEVVDDQGPLNGSYKLRQRSKFVAVPPTQSASGIIEETRCAKVNSKLSIQRRDFRWSASASRLIPSKFVTVEVSDEQVRAGCR